MQTFKSAQKLILGDIIEVSTGFAIVIGLRMNNSTPDAPLVTVSTKGILSAELYDYDCGAGTQHEIFVGGC